MQKQKTEDKVEKRKLNNILFDYYITSPLYIITPPLTFWIRGWTGDGVFGVGWVSGGDWGLLSCTCFVFRSIWLQLFISANNLCSVISSISSKIQTRVMQQFSDKQTQTVCTETLGFINFFKVVKVTIVPPFPDHSTSPVLSLGNFLCFFLVKLMFRWVNL